jgi:hypothetical protein
VGVGECYTGLASVTNREEPMRVDDLVRSLEQFPTTLRAVVSGLTDEEARRKPASGAWSILEIVTHLADEEVEDFRRRVEMTLREPDETWPGIDPEGWAVERQYNEGQLSESIERFVKERSESVRWLRALDDPPWDRAHEHPKLGVLRAGDLLAAWTAHDMLHLRQIAKRRYEVIEMAAEPFSIAYAGAWSA